MQRRHQSIIDLSRDHHHGLILAQLIRKNAPIYKNLPASPEGKTEYALNAYETELLPHFKKEEEILFPAVKRKNDELKELVNQLIADHKKIIGLIEKLRNDENKIAILDELGSLLIQHIRKEERELFKIIQDVLTEEELEKLDNLFSN
ncbi:MAG: hemerythrin domain-containing protein [Ignavibacteriales bacterium]|nr:MAG: hemerythrin domain-containing protein [Ignavibacteriales bacterium]